MIKVKGRKIRFTGKDYKILKHVSDDLGLSMQDVFTGLLWEGVTREAHKGTFLNEKKKEVVA